MKYAITGGTGFVGRAVCKQLASEGHEAVALSRRTGTGVGDVGELERAFAGCDGVIHCAGINRELRGQTYAQVHVAGTRNVIAAANRAGVRKLVMMSFLRARPACGSPYHESKWAAEELVRASGLDYTVIKAGVIYGSGDHMLDHLTRGRLTLPVFGLVGMRAQPMRPTAVRDLARVLCAALTDERLANKTVPVTGAREITLREAVETVGAAIDRRPLFVRLPVAVHYALGHLLECVMRVPMISLAQVRILSESLVEPWGEVDELPTDLRPSTGFDADSIAEQLPEPARFGAADLQLSCCAR
jgi:uncharacterized protein YbjT (DUF2867 family)